MAFENLEENVSSALLLASVGLLLFFCVWNRRPSGIPPFPVTPLPVIGNLLSMKPDARHLFAKWRKECGDIFSLYMGSQLVIVLNGYDCLKEALVKNADIFSERPGVAVFTQVLRNRGIVSTSGARWKSQRKFAVSSLRDFGFGRNSLEGEILQEAENVVKYFNSNVGRKENFGHIYNISTSNILCSVVFGRRYEYDDPMFIECCNAVETFLSAMPNTGLGNFLPFLQYLPGDLAGIRQSVNSIEHLHNFLIKPEIERHMKNYDGTVTDFIFACIKEIKNSENSGMDIQDFQKNFTQTICDLFLGGTDTTATTLKWMVLFLIHNPRVQEKCFEEIQENVGVDRLPELKDKALLPYVEAMFFETQRRANILPFGALRGIAKDAVFRGFMFPKGSVVMTNLDSVLMDSKVWPNPEEFRPERFLDKDGKFYKPPEFLPFSAGRRACLGEALAKMELFLIGAALIQRFHFQLPGDERLPSLTPVAGITFAPMPYKVEVVARK